MHKRPFTPFLLLIAALLIPSGILVAQPTVYPVGPDDGIGFDQVSFDFGGGFAYPFSHWGAFWITPSVFCETAPMRRGFINVETGQGHVVDNLPIDCQERLLSDDPITAYFQLKDLDDHTTPVDELQVKVAFSGDPLFPPLMSAPQINIQIPHDFSYTSGGCTEVVISSLPNPPAPAMPSTGTGPTESHILPNAINVESAHSQCFPISIANSLQYLEARFGLPVPNDHVLGIKGDDSLVGELDMRSDRPIASRRDGSGTPHRSMMRAKMEYLDDNDLEDGLVMKHQGRGFGSEPLEDGDFTIGTVFTVTSKDDGPVVTWQWICDQIKAGEDVELTYDWPGGGHAVRIYGCGRTNGKPWLRYLHDRNQDDDTKGLETVQVYTEDLDSDGTINFGDADSEVRFAWSESVTDEVKTGEFAPPQTTAESIVNAASFLDKKLTGGAIGTVFGIFKGAVSEGEGGNLLEEARAEQALPNTLNGVQVWINDEAVPLFFAGEGQVNFLVPTDLEPGTASLVVMVNGVPSDLVAFPVAEAAPELFTLPAEIAGPGRAVIQNEDFSVVTPDNPAPVGKGIILYLTGTGPTNPPIPTGELAPSSPPALLALEATVTIGGVPAQVDFAGAAPGFAGLTQINVRVPALDPGDHTIVVTVGGVDSTDLLVAVGP